MANEKDPYLKSYDEIDMKLDYDEGVIKEVYENLKKSQVSLSAEEQAIINENLEELYKS
jgi:uncharacterized membrane protein